MIHRVDLRDGLVDVTEHQPDTVVALEERVDVRLLERKQLAEQPCLDLRRTPRAPRARATTAELSASSASGSAGSPPPPAPARSSPPGISRASAAWFGASKNDTRRFGSGRATPSPDVLAPKPGPGRAESPAADSVRV
jgi:hypothetical protein